MTASASRSKSAAPRKLPAVRETGSSQPALFIPKEGCPAIEKSWGPGLAGLGHGEDDRVELRAEFRCVAFAYRFRCRHRLAQEARELPADVAERLNVEPPPPANRGESDGRPRCTKPSRRVRTSRNTRTKSPVAPANMKPPVAAARTRSREPDGHSRRRQIQGQLVLP